jgi:hypothetical protein
VKSIYLKRDGETLQLKNFSGGVEIVLIFPVTRDEPNSPKKWQAILDFVQESEISSLVLIDKTQKSSASRFFLSHFETEDKQLIVLPRSIKDTLFDTVGELVLEESMWIFQLHDDDQWSGKVSLPQTAKPDVVYFFDFYLNSQSNKVQIKDFSMPNRIVFSLVPTKIWNRFSKVVQDQKHHVAGSFDFTLNMMAHLVCKFEYQPGFQYYWKDDNWDTSKNAVAHLTRLAESDGWEDWSSPEISILNRSIDSIASLNYVNDILNPMEISKEAERLIEDFSPSHRKRLKYGIFILTLTIIINARCIFFKSIRMIDQKSQKLSKQLAFYRFISGTWNIKTIDHVIDTIVSIESRGGFEKLQDRFQFWKKSISGIR